jgi:hypothetical protein
MELYGKIITLLVSLGEYLMLSNHFGKKDEYILRNEHLDQRMNDEITYFS